VVVLVVVGELAFVTANFGANGTARRRIGHQPSRVPSVQFDVVFEAGQRVEISVARLALVASVFEPEASPLVAAFVDSAVTNHCVVTLESLVVALSAVKRNEATFSVFPQPRATHEFLKRRIRFYSNWIYVEW